MDKCMGTVEKALQREKNLSWANDPMRAAPDFPAEPHRKSSVDSGRAEDGSEEDDNKNPGLEKAKACSR